MLAAGQIPLEVPEQEDVVDELVIGAGTRSEQAAGVPRQVLRDAGLVAFAREALRGAHEGLELRRLGTELPEQPDAADGLRGLVGQQRQEGDVLLGEGVEPVGVAIHDADDVAHELHRDGEFGADAFAELDVARILGHVRHALGFGVQGDPPGDALPLLDHAGRRIRIEPIADLDAERAGSGLDQGDGGARGLQGPDDLLEDEVQRLARVFGGVDEGADPIQAVQDARVAGAFLGELPVGHGQSE
jgi:hypothetical protein